MKRILLVVAIVLTFVSLCEAQVLPRRGARIRGNNNVVINNNGGGAASAAVGGFGGGVAASAVGGARVQGLRVRNFGVRSFGHGGGRVAVLGVPAYVQQQPLFIQQAAPLYIQQAAPVCVQSFGVQTFGIQSHCGGGVSASAAVGY